MNESRDTVERAEPPCRTCHANRRDFLVGIAAAAASVPSVSAWAATPLDVDVSKVAAGSSLTVMWDDKPVLIRHRAPGEIAAAAKDAGLKDPQPDSARVSNPAWLVVVALCTHKGCQVEEALPDGDTFAGWVCPCHGATYDTSGRVTRGPASRNLVVPPYRLIGEGTLRLG